MMAEDSTPKLNPPDLPSQEIESEMIEVFAPDPKGRALARLIASVVRSLFSWFTGLSGR